MSERTTLILRKKLMIVIYVGININGNEEKEYNELDISSVLLTSINNHQLPDLYVST